MQEGKSAGFGAFSGQVDSYVRKNHARTREGKLERITVILGVLFFVIAIGLCLKFFQ
jgi:preprotein translocase subunit SecG